MSSGSPKSRIDQFFASKKRRPPKDEKPDKDPRTTPDGSPSAKGTLDSYLVTSPDAGAPTRVPIKRNLTRDIDLSSDAARITSRIEECSADARERAPDETSTAVAGKEVSSRSAEGNPELRRFASDFLSLYCSDLPSAANLTEEQDVKGQKRNGSPSLLIACSKTCGKKQCVVDQADPIASTSSAQEGAGTDICDTKIKIAEESAAQPMEVNESGGNTCMGLRRCNTTPITDLIKSGIGLPGMLASGGRATSTPKSLFRASRFSPGDDFWNEAIQVADGLFVPANELLNNQCLLKSGKSITKPLKDHPSSDSPEAQDAESNVTVKRTEKPSGEIKMSSAVPHASPLPVKHFDFCQDECNEITEKKSKSGITEKADAVTDVGSVLAYSSLVKHRSMQTSSMLLHHGPSTSGQSFGKKSSSSNMQLDMYPSDRSGSFKKVPQDELNTSDLAVDKGRVGLLIQENDVNQRHLEKNLAAGPKLPLCDTPNVKEEIKSRAGISEETSTPSSSMPLNDRLQLNNWLTPEICSIYMKKGISKLYPWQVDCLLVDGVLDKRNLVYCASTSAGKSFVAEILMLRRILSTGKMALLVLPYVSICAEKAEHLEVLLEPLGKHVRSFYGNQGGGSLPKETSVAVCTIEKANSLLNRLIEEGRLSELGIIVIDELHMVGDQHRGYLLELMLTKLRYAAGEGKSESCSGESSGTSSGKGDPAHGLQIVGMSATMPNIASVADWLQAALYQTDFRPVPLEEYVKVGNTIYDKKMDVVRVIPKTVDIGGKDPDHIVELCSEVVQEGHSVLLFCSSRKGCESTARHVARFLKKFCVSSHKDSGDFRDASSAIEALRESPAGLDPILEETLPSGVAYHHAGLTVEEREIVETCYRKGLVRVLTATSTLAAGVNLPARRVIFRQPRVGRDFIDGTRYRQMAGRAGRTGIDTRGESILICKPDEIRRITSIINDSCPPLQSCLSEDKNGMTHAILEVVAGGIVQTAGDLNRYVRCTLLNSTKPFQDVVISAQDSLRWLCHKKFLQWNEETKLYSTTPLGRAAFGSSLTPEESLVVLDDLSRAREGFILASDLHLVYLVTPINVDVGPDWELYYERFMQLSALDQSVGNRVGVVEPFLMRMAHGAPMPVQDRLGGKTNGLQVRLKTRGLADNNNTLLNEHTLRVSKRFYVALMLSRLVQEVPITDVCEAFKVARGMIQALQENSGRFASMVAMFCERLGWLDLEGLVSKFQNRVSFGVRAEIVELTTIPYVKGSRARALYKAGLRTPLSIAEASVREIANALFESSAWSGQEVGVQRMQLGIAKKIKNGARKIILDQAEEARAAAFSAFKSLGVHVPHFSRPLLLTTSEAPLAKGDILASSEEEAMTCYVGREQDDAQLVASPVVDGNTIRKIDTSAEIVQKSPAKTTTMAVDVAAEVNTTRGMQPDCYPGNAGLQVETSSVNHDPPGNDDTRVSGEPYFTEERRSSHSSVLHTKLERDQNEVDISGGQQSKYSNGSCSDKGPTNASSFPGGFDSFLDQWDTAGDFYFDVHFSRRPELQSPVLFEVFGLAICWENSPVYYVNISKDLLANCRHSVSGNVLRNTDPGATTSPAVDDLWEIAKIRWKRIASIMGRSTVRKFTWNLKTQLQVLKIPCISIQRFTRVGIECTVLNDLEVIESSYILLPSISVHDGIDMCLVTWILWPDEESKCPPNLEKLVKKRLPSGAAAAASRDGRWRNQMHKAAHDGCCRRVAHIRALAFALWKLLVSEDLVSPLTEIENPVVKVLADMELWGIGVDMEACLHARHILVKKLKELEKEAYTLAGTTFSLHTAADIANVLYTRLKLPIPCKKGKLHPSTNKHSLDLLRGQHPIISVIKEHRTLAKLLNSTLGSILSRARLCMKSQKYTVQGHWLQTSTATGRLSMEEPNLQCVEHPVVFTTHHADKVSSSSSNIGSHKINARDFFIPTQENWLLLTADYSQIELRLMAHFSKDSSLIELLRKPDGDVFTMLAARWTCKTEIAVSSQERDQTKRLVYGILYGMGANSLAEQLECCSEEAAEKIKSFKTSFPGVSSWLLEAVTSCRQKGYVQTLMGRKRYLSKIKFGDNEEKAKAQRQAVNSICQGSAADIIKMAMINLHSVIVEGGEPHKPNSLATKFAVLRGRCRILLQVHDELVLEVDSHLKKEAGSLLQMSMESAASLLVPLRVKLKLGRSWGSLEPYQPEP